MRCYPGFHVKKQSGKFDNILNFVFVNSYFGNKFRKRRTRWRSICIPLVSYYTKKKKNPILMWFKMTFAVRGRVCMWNFCRKMYCPPHFKSLQAGFLDILPFTRVLKFKIGNAKMHSIFQAAQILPHRTSLKSVTFWVIGFFCYKK